MFLCGDALHWSECFRAGWVFLMLQQWQNLGRRFGTSKMHLSLPQWLMLLSVLRVVVQLMLTFCLLLLLLWESVIVLCFVVRCFVSSLVLRSSWWGKGGGAGCFAWFVFLVSRDGCVALPRGAMGLPSVCDCVIS